jgi:tetratricopeptide (TPR) repeat protein
VFFLIIVISLFTSCAIIAPNNSQLPQSHIPIPDTVSIQYLGPSEISRLEYIECLMTPRIEKHTVFVDISYTPVIELDSILQKKMIYPVAAQSDSIVTIKQWSITHRGEMLLNVRSFDKHGDTTNYEYPESENIELKYYLGSLPEKVDDLSNPYSGLQIVKTQLPVKILPQIVNHYKRVGDLEGITILQNYLEETNLGIHANECSIVIDSLNLEMKVSELKKQKQNCESELIRLNETKINNPSENAKLEESRILRGQVVAMLDRGTRYGDTRRDEVEVAYSPYSDNAVLITYSIPFSNVGEYFAMRVTKKGEREYIRNNGFTVVVNVYEEVDMKEYNIYDSKKRKHQNYLNGLEDKREEIKGLEKKIANQKIKVAKNVDWDAAVLHLVSTIQNARTKAYTLHDIAVELARAGRYEQAIQLAETIQNSDAKVYTLQLIAIELAKGGKFKNAIQLVESIQKASISAFLLSKIAIEQIKAGKDEQAADLFSQAIQAAESIQDIKSKAFALKRIAVELAKAGRYEQAIQLAESIQADYPKVSALGDIAIEQIKAGKDEQAADLFSQAIQAAESFDDISSKVLTLNHFTIELARAGRYEQAIQLAETTQRTSSKTSALDRIAVELARAGRYEQAIQLAESIPDVRSKSSALGNIAIELIKAEKDELAADLFSQAIRAAESLDDISSKVLTLNHFAVELAKVGRYEQAIQLAETIQNPYSKAIALDRIAVELARAGRYEQAIQLAESIQADNRKVSALGDIAIEQIKAERYEDVGYLLHSAFAAIQSAQSNSGRDHQLRLIATDIIRIKLIDKGMSAKIAQIILFYC